ncbi:hypothetical protein L596_004479 [Steinernema carpocapsae]|uniref:Uncharacterized protein n=1 Tax=Steinernema carpocapsae TaxID=34508 RepID=A0A4U8UW19_STECR|nr:hypothetical protein L596_004479 [Steinernema carpocapsae]
MSAKVYRPVVVTDSPECATGNSKFTKRRLLVESLPSLLLLLLLIASSTVFHLRISTLEQQLARVSTGDQDVMALRVDDAGTPITSILQIEMGADQWTVWPAAPGLNPANSGTQSRLWSLMHYRGLLCLGIDHV